MQRWFPFPCQNQHRPVKYKSIILFTAQIHRQIYSFLWCLVTSMSIHKDTLLLSTIFCNKGKALFVECGILSNWRNFHHWRQRKVLLKCKYYHFDEMFITGCNATYHFVKFHLKKYINITISCTSSMKIQEIWMPTSCKLATWRKNILIVCVTIFVTVLQMCVHQRREFNSKDVSKTYFRKAIINIKLTIPYKTAEMYHIDRDISTYNRAIWEMIEILLQIIYKNTFLNDS